MSRGRPGAPRCVRDDGSAAPRLTEPQLRALDWIESGIGRRGIWRCLRGLVPLGRVGGWLGLSVVYAMLRGRVTVTCSGRIVGQLALRDRELHPDRALRSWCADRGVPAAQLSKELTHRLATHALEVLWPAVQDAEQEVNALSLSSLALDLAWLLAHRGGQELPARELARRTGSSVGRVHRALGELRGRGLVEHRRPGWSTLRWVDLDRLIASCSSRHEAHR